MSKNPPEVVVTPKMAVKPEVIELGEKLRKHLKVDGKGFKEVEKTAYFEAGEASGVTEEYELKRSKFRTNFIPAAALVAGEEAQPIFKKHPDVESVAVTFPTVGKDSITVEVRREQQVPNNNAKEGEPKTRTSYGGVTVKLHEQAAKGDVGQLKHVKASLAEQYQSAFGKA